MNIKEILSDIIPKAEISGENRKMLTDWLNQFEKAPDNQELFEQIEQLKAERDSARKSLNDMIFKNHVARLAETYSFSDKGYLEYLCRINEIDFDDAERSKEFMNRLQSDSPKFFKINMQSGSGSPPPQTNCKNPQEYHDSSNDILSLLNNAPEFRR